jgi:hypothetical protein
MNDPLLLPPLLKQHDYGGSVRLGLASRNFVNPPSELMLGDERVSA